MNKVQKLLSSVLDTRLAAGLRHKHLCRLLEAVDQGYPVTVTSGQALGLLRLRSAKARLLRDRLEIWHDQGASEMGPFVKVEVTENRYGHLEVEPKSPQTRRRIIESLLDLKEGGSVVSIPVEGDSLVYLQTEDEIGCFLGHLSDAQRARLQRELKGGWTATITYPLMLLRADAGCKV